MAGAGGVGETPGGGRSGWVNRRAARGAGVGRRAARGGGNVVPGREYTGRTGDGEVST